MECLNQIKPISSNIYHFVIIKSFQILFFFSLKCILYITVVCSQLTVQQTAHQNFLYLYNDLVSIDKHFPVLPHTSTVPLLFPASGNHHLTLFS